MRSTLGRFASTTLAGEDLAVPDDLQGPTLLLFAYRMWQQRDVDTWLAVVADRTDVAVLEVPVLGRQWQPVRGWIDGGMKSAMDQRTREQTMCVYTSVSSFRRDTLGVDRGDVLAVLVEADGTVRWHAFGPADASGARSLLAAIGDGDGSEPDANRGGR